MKWRWGSLILCLVPMLPLMAAETTVQRVELRLSGTSYISINNAVIRREGNLLVIESDDPLPTTTGTDCRVDVSGHSVLNLDSLSAERVAVYARDHARIDVTSMACGSSATFTAGFGRIRQATSE